MELFLFFATHGIFAGLAYLVFMFLRGILNNELVSTIVFDFACGVIMGGLLLRANILANIGTIKAQFIIYFTLGVAVTIITFEKFVASASKSVYNKIRKSIIKLINNKRRKNNGCTKTAKKS